LATQCGHSDVDAMLASMRAIQMYEWEQYFLLEPFGSEVNELRSAAISSTIANVNRDPNTRAQPYLPSDFFVAIPRKEEQQSVADMFEVLKGVVGG